MKSLTVYEQVCQDLDELFAPKPTQPKRRRRAKWQIDQEIDRGMFPEYKAEAIRLNETNDCAVRSVAATTGVSYGEAHAALAAAGRKPRQGCTTMQIHHAIRSLGYRVARLAAQAHEITAELAIHKNYNVKNLTTRQITMFPEFFADHLGWSNHSGILLYTDGHVVGYAGGKVHDFGASRALRVYAIYMVLKNGTIEEGI